jgi:hypothetical protein
MTLREVPVLRAEICFCEQGRQLALLTVVRLPPELMFQLQARRPQMQLDSIFYPRVGQ